jgi:DNA invertase Pin-like site-specific DNA recombinase
LFLGTRVDNSIDMDAKGRRKTVRGEQNGKAILTADQIPAIRKMYADGMSPRAIGERVGVHGSTIRMVVKGLTWGHVR